MRKRVLGLETETFGYYLEPDGTWHTQKSEKVNEHLRSFLEFLRDKYGRFNTGQNVATRAILPNQAQVYIDTMAHFFEIATSECVSLSDLLLQQRTSLASVAEDLKLYNRGLRTDSGHPRTGLHLIAKSGNIAGDRTCGCHENYQGAIEIPAGHGRTVRSWNTIRHVLPPFLLARKLLDGSGHLYLRSVLENYGEKPKQELVYGISQRLEFIKKVWSKDTSRLYRPMILTGRGEPLTADVNTPCELRSRVVNFERWQVLSGDHSLTPFGDFIKMGSVSILLEMIEEGFFFDKIAEIPVPECMNTDTGEITGDDFERINHDLRCRNTYIAREGHGGEKQVTLPDILEIYAGWMMDYLERGNYSGPEPDEKLYAEKLTVAEKILRAADCFRHGDLFEMEEDVEWIMKLRWVLDHFSDAGVAIDDDEIGTLTDLRKITIERGEIDGNDLDRFVEDVLWRDWNWHSLDNDPLTCHYRNLEDCGLVNPVSVDGTVVDLSPRAVARNKDKVALNPMTRSFARKKLCDFFRQHGIENQLEISWIKGEFSFNDSTEDKGETELRTALNKLARPRGIDLDWLVLEFQRRLTFHFYDPQRVDYPEVDSLIEWFGKFF